MYVLCGCSEGPLSGEGLSGRPGPLPLRQGSLELGPRWSGWPSFPQETPTVCRSANTHCHAGLASVMESPHPCVLGAVCTVGMPVPQPLCDVRNQVAGRSAGEKSIMRSCVFLERQFCAFSIQLRLPASACRGHCEGTGGEWQAVRGLWRLTLVDCKHQFALLGGVSLVWKSFCPLMGTRLAVCASEWEWGGLCVPHPPALEAHPSITHHPTEKPPPGSRHQDVLPQGTTQIPKIVGSHRVSSCGHLQFILGTKCFLCK